ncbi:MAG: deoxyribose-phosphate aldolase [Armatimonadota bacterium]
MYTKEQFAKLIDHTLLKPTATKQDIIKFCEDARKYHFAAAVIFPFWVRLAVTQLQGSDVKICTTVGFPYGANTRVTKINESKNAVANGAEEIDVVMNVGALKTGDYDFVKRELADIVDATNFSGMTQDSGSTLVKVIIETPLLSTEEKVKACEICREAGVDFIKTATGLAPNGAVVEDIKLIRSVVGPTIGVKAAGGIRTVEQAMNLLDAGASRLGTSAGITLMQTYDPDMLLKGVK